MTSIEQTRKEFFNGDFTLREIGLQTIAYQMGIEDAQKEFLDKINKWAKDNFFWNDDTNQYELDGLYVPIEELKQSLEVKE